MTAPRIWTIPAGADFLDALAVGITAVSGDDPAALSRVTVLLPTRRAGRALREAFLRRAGGRPLLLPRLRPLGDVDDDELALAGEGGFIDLPPAIAPLRRRLMLARAILALEPRDSERTAAQAVELAAELAHLLDQVQTERIGFAGLEKLVPDELAEHWRRTVKFLSILTAKWPDILAGEGALDPAERRNQALAALAQHWTATPPQHPVIAAGSTGSIPATAELLRAVASLPRGAVVLPGLDRDLDDESWQALEPTHPQYGLKQLLERLDVNREAVQDWPHAVSPKQAAARRKLVSTAFLPAASASGWNSIDKLPREAVAGLLRVEAAHPQQEAQIIALLLREALETEGRTAALVTPDRDLARRVAAELGRFGLAVDDSAGKPLAATPPLVYLRLLAEAIAEKAAPAKLLALFKHPLTGGGIDTAAFRNHAREMEKAVLRGPRPAPGLAALVEALRDEKKSDLAQWLADLAEAAREFETLMDGNAKPAELLRAHVALAETWAATDTETGAARLWATDAGAAAADFVAELADSARDFDVLDGGAYPAFFESCLAGRVVRPAWGGHPRLHILGPLEARLLSFDLTILGGLNEGTWPHESAADPWMSRPMRASFGLPPPERRIGLAAHDVAQALCGRDVVLTRAARVEGTPEVPSRWLQRLDAVLRAAGLDDDLAHRRRVDAILSWQALLDASDSPPSTPQAPQPRPPLKARPRKLAVTEIETWRHDPYAIYAKHVLRLRALDPIDMDPGAAERGTFVHDALHAFVAAHPRTLPPDALEILLRLGAQEFGAALARPGVWAFWWPRFEAIASWFLAHEKEWRRDAVPVIGEGRGAMKIAVRGGEFTLTARADRIDRLGDGSLAIIDYKTGGLPKLRDVRDGYAPQLPLEVAIARSGGFGVAAAPVTQLWYWRLTGGDPPGEELRVDGAKLDHGKEILGDPAALADQALAGLKAMIDRFDDKETPYHARPDPDHRLRYNDYAHLARVKEWSAEDDT